MLINNVVIVRERDRFVGHVRCAGGTIAFVGKGLAADPGFDGRGALLLPAYWDTHTHGGYGLSFNGLTEWDPVAAQRYLDGVVQEGVCSVLATAVTDTVANLQKIANNYKRLKALDKNDVVKGLYWEGPFLSPSKKGAHDPRLMLPFNRANLAAVTVPDLKVLTVAPDDFAAEGYAAVKTASQRFSVAIGHTDATAAQFGQAVASGANRVTHLYNAMSGFEHRAPGVVNGVLAAKGMFVEFIVDGKHVDPLVVNETIDLLGKRHRFVFVTDSMPIKGAPVKETMLGPVAVERRGDFCYVKDTETLAGSCMPYDKMVTVFNAYAAPDPCQVVSYTSANPARALNMSAQTGIYAGRPASFVLADPKRLTVRHVFIRGAQIK